MKINYNLVLAGFLTILVGMLFLCVIIGGPEWYRYFGLGEQAASQVEQGLLRPQGQTFVLAVMLIIWGLLCFFRRRIIKTPAVTQAITSVDHNHIFITRYCVYTCLFV